MVVSLYTGKKATEEYTADGVESPFPYSTQWNMLYIDSTWTSIILMVRFWTSHYHSLDLKASKCQRQRPASILSQALWYPHTVLGPQSRMTTTHRRLVKAKKMREMDCKDKSNCNAQFRVIFRVGWKDTEFTLYLQTSFFNYFSLFGYQLWLQTKVSKPGLNGFFSSCISASGMTRLSASLLTKPWCPISKMARIIFLHLRRAPQK